MRYPVGFRPSWQAALDAAIEAASMTGLRYYVEKCYRGIHPEEWYSGITETCGTPIERSPMFEDGTLAGHRLCFGCLCPCHYRWEFAPVDVPDRELHMGVRV